ncbi:MAG: hypothetical protein NPINA01_25580 [Nitrospinaceae bacterium]|nr:MAG: hypothetical protein NPINA01_25580 [Nitrospinaceae bacterium]
MRPISRVLIIKLLAMVCIVLMCVGSALAVGLKDKKPVAQSVDQRYKDFGDGTILDSKTGLMWMKEDYWQREGKWVNWYNAKNYVQRMNNKNFAGYSDWRLPTPEEAQTLYERRKRNLDKDGDKIYMDRMFPAGAGWSTWTNKEKSNKAVVVSWKDEGGEHFQDKISGIDAFLRLIRGPVS